MQITRSRTGKDYFAGKLQIIICILKVFNSIINRVQIQIAHVSEIDSLLGNRALDFFY